MTTTALREKPILFSGEMVRAILDGRKSATRRVVKLRDPSGTYSCNDDDGWPMSADECGDWSRDACPYGWPGDRLWVRETWGIRGWMDDGAVMGGLKPPGLRLRLVYRDEDGESGGRSYWPDSTGYERIRALVKSYKDETCWRPSIFMPRWASRITLEVVSVRVERLHEITESDANLEGVMGLDTEFIQDVARNAAYRGQKQVGAVDYFEGLWQKLNGKKHPWESNPFVWRIEFRTESP